MPNQHSNKEEHHNFLRTALIWRGSVTPRIFLSVLIASLYTLGLAWIDARYYKLPHLEVTPFEYTGAVLGLLLIFRTNAGHDRWWEARKLWGAIVNQSRNLLLMVWNYGANDKHWRDEMTKWIIVFPFATKEFLRLQRNFEEVNDLLSHSEIAELQNAPHMPVFVSNKIAELLGQARASHMFDGFAFQQFENQRAALIDSIGGCERILKTPMPLVYVIKVRRFIFLYLLLLPFSLINVMDLMSAPIVLLVAYPLLSLDRIGFELQNPFSVRSLSHLPLETICAGIKSVGVTLSNNQERASGSAE